ncbi:hypothetical protein BDZ91DRAFT_754967 [Kalaharituber pfeilii]|nr:hypothetical protein BDZ91DRAFT_754967 [Kalaharituber pfeilii]
MDHPSFLSILHILHFFAFDFNIMDTSRCIRCHLVKPILEFTVSGRRSQAQFPEDLSIMFGIY